MYGYEVCSSSSLQVALVTLFLTVTLEDYNQPLTRCTGSEVLLEYMICSYEISLVEFAMWEKSPNSSDIRHLRARTFSLY